MATKTFGYARVSSRDQNEQRQIDSILPLLEDERDLYVDKQSGKDFNRPRYQALKAVLRSGDTVIIHSLDRLGRNYDQIREEWNFFMKNDIAVKILDMPLLNTSETDGNNLQRKLIADITLSLLSYVAEKERENIRTRQAQGIKSAKARGVKFGREKILPENFDSVYADWKAGSISAVEAQKILGMKCGILKRDTASPNFGTGADRTHICSPLPQQHQYNRSKNQKKTPISPGKHN